MEKNTQLSQELEECKAQLRAAVAAMKESAKAPSGNTCFYRKEGYVPVSIRHVCKSNNRFCRGHRSECGGRARG